jgi:hypothetical protein
VPLADGDDMVGALAIATIFAAVGSLFGAAGAVVALAMAVVMAFWSFWQTGPW